MYQLKKSLGQHFLKDEAVCRKIIGVLKEQSFDRLLEVGPGGGALTKYLLQLPGIVFLAIELDEEKVAWLEKQFPEIRGKLLQADILEVDCPFDQPFAIVGNFPYNISSQILFRVLEWEPQVTCVVGMFQKEVAKRIVSPEGSREYGILSVLIQAFFEVEYLFDVSESAFVPPPKVTSGVILLKNANNPFGISDKKKFIRLVKTAFGQRRKQLRNPLKPLFHADVLKAEIFTKRAEQLRVSDFVDLMKQML